MNLPKLALAGFALLAGPVAAQAADSPRPPMPRYDHIFVIIDENKGFDQLMQHPDWAPNIQRLANEYGLATQFYGEVHSSEGNYVAMVGGDTFGIHDDDAFYCKPGPRSEFCQRSDWPGYVDHTIFARSWPINSEAQPSHLERLFRGSSGAGLSDAALAHRHLSGRRIAEGTLRRQA